MNKQPNTISYRNSQDTKTRENKNVEQEELDVSTSGCLFCIKFGTQPFVKIDFGPLLNRALHTKYATHTSPQIQQDISQIIEKQSVQWVIKFNDDIQMEEKYEYLTKFYKHRERYNKFNSLKEYFKYHKDIPRLFMRQLGVVVVNYFEKQKHLKYKQIKRMLGIPFEERTNLQTERYNTDGEICKPQNYMILDEVTLDTKPPTIELDPVNNISSQSLLRELLKNRPVEYNNVNISDTWISMNQSNVNKQIFQPDQIISPTSNSKHATDTRRKILSAKSDQFSEQRLQALLNQPKTQEKLKVYQNLQTMRSVKSQNSSQKEVQEQIIRKLILDSCFKKKIDDSNQKIYEQIGYSQYSPKFKSQRQKPDIKPSLSFKVSTSGEKLIQQTSMNSAKIMGQRYKPPAINFQIQDKIINRFSGKQEQQLIIKPKIVNQAKTPNMNRLLSNEKQQAQESLKLQNIRSFETFKNFLMVDTVVNKKSQRPQQQFQVQELKTQIPSKLLSHHKSQTYYTEQSFSPIPLISFQNQKLSHPSANRLSQLMTMNQPKQNITSQRDHILSHQSQPDINININQLNMNNMHFQQRGSTHNTRQFKSNSLSQSASLHQIIKKSNQTNQHYSNNYYHNKNPQMKFVQNPPDRMKPRFNSKLSLKLT